MTLSRRTTPWSSIRCGSPTASSRRTTRSSPRGRRPTASRSRDAPSDKPVAGASVVEGEGEGRVIRQDPLDVLIRRLGVDAQKALHLPGPLVHVETHQGKFLVVGNLRGVEAADVAPAAKLSLAGDPQVPDPLGRAARGKQVGLAVE